MMLWPTRDFEFQQIINAPKDTVIAFIQQPRNLLSLSPHARRIDANLNTPEKFTVVDLIPVIGLLKFQTTFEVIVTSTDDGVATLVSASLGTTLKGSWTVSERLEQDGQRVTVIHERVTLQWTPNNNAGTGGGSGSTEGVVAFAITSLCSSRRDVYIAFKGFGEGGTWTPINETHHDSLSGHLLITLTMIFSVCLITFHFSTQKTLPHSEFWNKYWSTITIGLLLYTALKRLLFPWLPPSRTIFGGRANTADSSSKNSFDPYGLFHLQLNRLPTEPEGEPPKTEWLNMGYWEKTKVFPDACRALALRMFRAANLQESDSVLDVGHGTGDSLLTLLCDTEIPQLSRLVGITSIKIHHERSYSRVKKLLQSQRFMDNTTHDTPLSVTLYCGDAIYRDPPTYPSTSITPPNHLNVESVGNVSENASNPTASVAITQNHPLNPDTSNQFDAVFALDCAYHFDTRDRFLSQAFGKLRSGGRIALADICFFTPNSILAPGSTVPILTTVDGNPPFLATHVLSSVIPRSNIISPSQYVSVLRNIGYTDVQLEDITPHVFPEFTTYMRNMRSKGGRRKWSWLLFGWLMDKGMNWLGGRFVIVSARKP